ncbi:MAG: hypothetical protein PHX07_01955 [Candidatus Marinimicrobia bacterium]|nr:hypothetical protein [Candidatus Neomarinimicrobiota bacterium]MDD5710103.1 hypothetical protein [Candidatus Neomarinimicrobiota bacterium]
MKKVTILMLVLLLVSLAFAQEGSDGKLDAGLRLGLMNVFGGATARYHLSENNAIEVIISTPGFKGMVFTGMYQWHKDFADVKNLSWYFGGGLHAGYWSAAVPRWNGTRWINRKFALGLDAIAGVSYDMESILNFPLAVSLDYKPAVDIISYWASLYYDVSLSIRYKF